MSGVGWHIVIDMQGGGRIHDKVHSPDFASPMLSAAIEDALEDASLLHAEPGEGAYQITATAHFE